MDPGGVSFRLEDREEFDDFPGLSIPDFRDIWDGPMSSVFFGFGHWSSRVALGAFMGGSGFSLWFFLCILGLSDSGGLLTLGLVNKVL